MVGVECECVLWAVVVVVFGGCVVVYVCMWFARKSLTAAKAIAGPAVVVGGHQQLHPRLCIPFLRRTSPKRPKPFAFRRGYYYLHRFLAS